MRGGRTMKKFCALLSIVLLAYFLMPFSASAEPIRIGLTDFVSRTDMMGYDSYYLEKVNKVFKDALSNSSSNIEVVTTKSSFSDIDDIVNSGQSTGCRYVILGALMKNDTDYSQSTSGGLFFSSIKIDTTTKQSIAIDVRIVDVSTGKIILSTSGTGIASYSASYNPVSAKDTKKFTETAQEKHNANLEKAMLSASSVAAEKVCAFLTGEYPKVSVIKGTDVKKNKGKKKSKKGETSSLGSIKIDRGSSTGVIEDAFYRIFFEGEEVFDFNGNSLGHEKFNIAIAQVKSVQTNSCTADVKGGKFNNIRNEDKAEQISSEEAEAIISQNDFANSRVAEFLK